MDTTTIHIASTGKRLTAVHIPNPEHAKNPRAVLEDGTTDDYMVVAIADRHYKSHGDTVSGWVIRCPFISVCSSPISNKREAKRQLKTLINAYFSTPGQPPAPVFSTADLDSLNHALNEYYADTEDTPGHHDLRPRLDQVRAGANPRVLYTGDEIALIAEIFHGGRELTDGPEYDLWMHLEDLVDQARAAC